MKIDTPEDLEKLVPGSKAVKEEAGRYLWIPPLGGVILDGKKQRGKGDQEENQESLFTVNVPLYMRGSKSSPWYIQNNKDGIKINADKCVLKNLIFLNSGEDCITSYGKKLKIRNCQFQADSNSDKCLQLNVFDGCEVTDCKFIGYITAIQCGLRKYADNKSLGTVKRCSFVNCETGVVSVKGSVQVKSNRFVGYNKIKYRVDKGGEFI